MSPAKRPSAEPHRPHDARPGSNTASDTASSSASSSNTTSSSGSGPPPPKRQRVSLACDHCRAARGRCDGRRPSCDVCLSQHRSCSYTSSTRRRGTPTGYLRAVESSLAYLLEQNPDNARLLDRLLRTGADVFTERTAEPSDRLHKRWTTSRFRKDMWRLLVDGYPSAPESDVSARDDDMATTTTESDDFFKTQLLPGALSSSASDGHQLNTPPSERMADDAKSCDLRPPPPQPKAQLPPNWRHLLDIYFSYTYCWLPLVERHTLVAAASSFPAEGIPLSQMSEVAPSHAELWAVLALASFQSASSPAAGQDAAAAPSPQHPLTPRSIYSIARNMMPSEEKRFELPHLRALLLHSIVLMGQGAGLAAWMLVGTAVRLALHLRETGDLYAGEDASTVASPGTRAFAASLILNTLASAYLGQPTFLSVDTEELSAAIDAMGEAGESEPWVPVLGGASPAAAAAAAAAAGEASPEANPLQAFRQLYKIAKIMSAILRAGGWRSNPVQGPRTEDLIKCLDPAFSFCNSVVLGSSTPSAPSSFVLHAFFLTALTQCAPGTRSSLLSSLREVVESCEAHFGPCGVPPVIVCIAGTALRSRHADKMDAYERSKWERLAGSVRTVWTDRAIGVFPRQAGLSSTETGSLDLLAPLSAQGPEAPVKSDVLGSLLDKQVNPAYLADGSLDGGGLVGWAEEPPTGFDSFLSDLDYAWMDPNTPYLC